MCDRALSSTRSVCCTLGAQPQLSLTAVSQETSDEMLHHLLSLCMWVYVCMSSWTQSQDFISFCFIFSLACVTEELSTVSVLCEVFYVHLSVCLEKYHIGRLD